MKYVKGHYVNGSKEGQGLFKFSNGDCYEVLSFILFLHSLLSSMIFVLLDIGFNIRIDRENFMEIPCVDMASSNMLTMTFTREILKMIRYIYSLVLLFSNQLFAYALALEFQWNIEKMDGIGTYTFADGDVYEV